MIPRRIQQCWKLQREDHSQKKSERWKTVQPKKPLLINARRRHEPEGRGQRAQVLKRSKTGVNNNRDGGWVKELPRKGKSSCWKKSTPKKSKKLGEKSSQDKKALKTPGPLKRTKQRIRGQRKGSFKKRGGTSSRGVDLALRKEKKGGEPDIVYSAGQPT